MTQLDGCILFWKSKLDHERYLMDVSSQTIIESTVKYLEELKKVKGGKENGTKAR